MDFAQAAALLRGQDRILILTHKRPDGDTIGCAVALCQALREQGKTAAILPNEDVTSLFAPYLEGYLAEEGFQPDFVVSVDIAGRQLFTPRGEVWLQRGIDLAIDHHPSYEGFAAQSCVDPARAACGELIYDLIAQCAGVLSDKPLFFAVNSYTEGLSPAVMQYILQTTLCPRYGGATACDEIGLPVSATGGVVPCGATALWQET